MNILLVEDDACLSQRTIPFFEQLGFNVCLVSDVEQILTRLKTPGIDIIVFSFEDPYISGMKLFGELRKTTIDVPMVVLGKKDDQELEEAYIKAGAQDFFVSDDDTKAEQIARCLNHAIVRKKTDLELRSSAERLTAILENSYDAFLSVDSQWRITDWNAEAEKTFGWTKDEAIGQSLVCIIPSHLRRQYMGSITEYFLQHQGKLLKTTRELIAINKLGHEFPIEIGIFKIEEDRDYKFCAFVRNIADKKESEEKLELLVQERTEKLTQSNEELRQFAKVASHDLQEPLRAVQGFASLLSENTKGKIDKNCEEFIDYILDGVNRMQYLIRSVLAHSQINANDSFKHATNCNWVLNDVLADLKETIAETSTIVEVDRLPRVAVERSQVVQLFQNLISNSIKYRRSESPQIFISAEKRQNKCLFTVRDNGIGIDPQYSEKIFDMFSRLHAKTKYEGTGIGLAICKRIVTSHGGTIWVESKPNEGSIFLFTLPMVESTRKEKMKDGIEILLAEDTPSDIRLTEEALRRSQLKYKLEIVNDGVEVMEYLHKLVREACRLPDIILLDLNMPRKNGHEVLAEVKKDPKLRQIPVILLTVSEREEDIQEALNQKMNYYLAKPVQWDKLSTLVKSIHELQTQMPDASAEFSDQEMHIRLVLAGNPHTSIVALTKLANDPSEKVRARVAENPSVVPAILEKLAQDPNSHVRTGICDNPSTPHSVLAILARDPSDDVRLELSSNPHIPVSLLRELASDDNIFVSSAANNTLSAINTTQLRD